MSAPATTRPQPVPLGFHLDDRHVAHEPPEGRGLRRDQVRLLVSHGAADPVHTRFAALPDHLRQGDLLVVNTSATVPAALDGLLDTEPVVVHVSTELPAGVWLVEVRRPTSHATEPLVVGRPTTVHLLGGGAVALLRPFPGSRRLWLAAFDLEPGASGAADSGVSAPAGGPSDVAGLLARHGHPIRYRYVSQEWPIEAYQTVFGREPGSAEMPSAGRPFSTEVVADLVRRGVGTAPLVLHTGVSSLEGGEAPYPERYRVPRMTAALVNATHDAGGRVVAVGTTVVRALETVTDERGVTHPGAGWTDTVVTPERPVRSVDGLVTGWHEPEASHLLMLEAVAGRDVLVRAYRAARAEGYLWHEFGDSHLILAERSERSERPERARGADRARRSPSPASPGR
jgi:S-adenosylmethionine:tRNA ribosyltransferase-isomerase